MGDDPGIGGNWDARKQHCSCGYEAVWTVTPVDGWDEIKVEEQASKVLRRRAKLLPEDAQNEA